MVHAMLFMSRWTSSLHTPLLPIKLISGANASLLITPSMHRSRRNAVVELTAHYLLIELISNANSTS